MDDEMLREMRIQTAIMRVAFHPQIEEFGKRLRDDDLASAIVEILSERGRMTGGDLWDAVESVDQSTARRTFNRRLVSLAESGVVHRIGSGRGTSYELTGLIQ